MEKSTSNKISTCIFIMQVLQIFGVKSAIFSFSNFQETLILRHL